MFRILITSKIVNIRVDQEKQRKICLNNKFLTLKLTLTPNRKGRKSGNRKRKKLLYAYESSQMLWDYHVGPMDKSSNLFFFKFNQILFSLKAVFSALCFKYVQNFVTIVLGSLL